MRVDGIIEFTTITDQEVPLKVNHSKDHVAA